MRPVSLIVAAPYPLLGVGVLPSEQIVPANGHQEIVKRFEPSQISRGSIYIRFSWTWQRGTDLDTHKNGCFGN